MRFEQGEVLTFDDVLIKPLFSTIKSRKDVDLTSPYMLGYKVGLRLPVFSANMDTITGVQMAKTMIAAGGMGVLHRFWSIEDNVKAFQETEAAVSVGLGEFELDRARALITAGARYFFIDVAHGATQEVADRLAELKNQGAPWVCVGNFASAESLSMFLHNCKTQPDAIKVGVGPGSACTTRIKTGVGVPQLSAIQQCAGETYIPIIADGGLRTPGDIAKALAVGASAVMIGGMLAGTDETPGSVTVVATKHSAFGQPLEFAEHKKYRGSASKESYEVQGKDTAWRTAEGESFTVLCKGPASNVLQDIEGGLRSSFAYVGALNLKEFQEKVVLISVSSASIKENGAHGKS